MGGHGEIVLHLPHIMAWGQGSHLQLLHYSCIKRALELLVLQWVTITISLPELVCRGEAHSFSRKSKKEIFKAHNEYLATSHMFSLMSSVVPFSYSVIIWEGLQEEFILCTRECNLREGDHLLHFGDHWRRFHCHCSIYFPSPMLYHIWVVAATLQLRHFLVLCILANPLEDWGNNVFWGWDISPPYLFEHILSYLPM